MIQRYGSNGLSIQDVPDQNGTAVRIFTSDGKPGGGSIPFGGPISIPYEIATPTNLTPASGQLVFNDLAAVTRLSASTIDSDSINWAALAAEFGTSGSAILGNLRVVKRSNLSTVRAYNVVSVAPPGSWGEEVTTTAPSARSSTAMVYDATRAEVVLFGGAALAGFAADTWTWNGKVWTLKSPATSPSARYGHSMVWDSVRGEVVLFGGNTGSRNDETWVWNGTTWTQKTPVDKPSARYWYAMAFDAGNSYALLWGGNTASGNSTETWKWDGTNWTVLSPATVPAARVLTSMAYDATRAKVVLAHFGVNAGDNKTYTWSGSNWIDAAPATQPVPMDGQTMEWDAARQKVVLFGGDAANTPYLNRTWEWDGTTWAEVTSVLLPPKRFQSVQAYDTARNRMVIFGGVGNDITLGDTWTRAPASTVDFDVTGEVTNGTLVATDDVLLMFERSGDRGTTGTIGAPLGMPFVFSSTITQADPGNGFLRLNNGSISAVTEIYVDNVMSTGDFATATLDTFDDSTNINKGFLRLLKTDEPQRYVYFSLQSVTTQTGYRELGVTYINASHSIPFLDGDALTMTFVATGDAGVVSDEIVDGVTTAAPSQNAVFDALALKAPLASPTFTGTPAAPTAAAGTNTTQLATTAHVFAERSNTSTLTNKTLTSPVINTPTGIVKGDVGLGNVDNTSDATKNSATATLTNKRFNPRVSTTASSSTPTPNADTDDQFNVTALAVGATFGAPTGTPVQGQQLIIRVLDNGTARTLAFNAVYRFSSDLAAPSTTIVNKTLYMGFQYNVESAKWDCLAILNGFA